MKRQFVRIRALTSSPVQHHEHRDEHDSGGEVVDAEIADAIEWHVTIQAVSFDNDLLEQDPRHEARCQNRAARNPRQIANASLVMSSSSDGRTLRLQPEFKSIGDVAAETGLSASAIRFYEKSGLVTPARSGGRRWFGPKERARLSIIAYLRKAGFGLDEAAAMLAPSGSADEGWRAAGAVAASRLGSEIAEREQALSRLETMLASCPCHDPVECEAGAGV